MTPAEVLERLHDIHPPVGPVGEDVSAGWTSTPLWVTVGILGLLLLARWLRRRQWRRQTRNELSRIRRLVAAGDTGQAMQRLSVLLRRLDQLDPSATPALIGDAWLQRLDTRFGTDAFTAGVGRLLESAPYQARPAVDPQRLDELLAVIRRGLTPR